MKKSFYSFVLLLITAATTSAQAPGGLAGSVLWLKANSATNTPALWTDESGTLNDFTQIDPDHRPELSANIFNFNQAFSFDGVNSFMTQPAPVGFPENSAARTIFVVANGANPSLFHWIFVYGTPSCVHCSFQVGGSDGGLANAFFGSEIIYPGYWGTATNLSGAFTAFSYDGLSGIQYDRGSLLQTQTVGALTATSVNGMIGALSPSVDQAWSGNIAEIIMFPTVLSDGDRHQVESYLALKYGFTLGNVSAPIDYVASDGTTIYWPASATYQNDVFGIGADAGTGLLQTQSNSMNTGDGQGSGQSGKGNIILGAPALTDKQFLVMGNDGGALTESIIASGEAPAIAEGSSRLQRNWKVKNTGSVSGVDMFVDMTGISSAGGTNSDNYRLMVDDDGDGDYGTGTPFFIKPAVFSGNNLIFSNVTLPDNSTIALITQGSSALLPATWQGFTVTLQKNVATLTWKTSDEINVDHYTAEYSVNGINYSSLGSVTAKNGSGVNTYTLTQANLPVGIRYFRIKRFDKDGKSDISTVKTVRVGGLNTVTLKSNPVMKGRLELNIDVQQNQEAVIRVISTTGTLLVQQKAGLSTGTNSITTNISHLATGTYFLQVQLSTEVITKKFTRM